MATHSKLDDDDQAVVEADLLDKIQKCTQDSTEMNLRYALADLRRDELEPVRKLYQEWYCLFAYQDHESSLYRLCLALGLEPDKQPRKRHNIVKVA